MPPRTIVANADVPSNVLSFALPPGVTIDVESVLAAIDNTAGADTGALLTIADSSGAVIARKRQSEKITAGTNPGSATWALRLADETASAAGASSVALLYEYVLPGTQAAIDTAVDGPMAGPLSQAYSVLEVWTSARTDTNTSAGLLAIRFNNDSGARYDQVFSEVQVTGGVAGQAYGRNLNATNVEARIPGLGSPAGCFGTCRFSIPQYAAVAPPTHTGEGQGGMVTSGANVPLWMDFGFTYHPAVAAGIDRVAISNLLGNLVTESALYIYGRK